MPSPGLRGKEREFHTSPVTSTASSSWHMCRQCARKAPECVWPQANEQQKEIKFAEGFIVSEDTLEDEADKGVGVDLSSHGALLQDPQQFGRQGDFHSGVAAMSSCLAARESATKTAMEAYKHVTRAIGDSHFAQRPCAAEARPDVFSDDDIFCKMMRQSAALVGKTMKLAPDGAFLKKDLQACHTLISNHKASMTQRLHVQMFGEKEKETETSAMRSLAACRRSSVDVSIPSHIENEATEGTT